MSAKSQISFLLALIVSLLGQSLHAVTKVAVGPSTCQPSLVHFSTIGAAVAAVPYGTTILVCPGTYPEQVVITQPLTIQGVTDGVGNAAVITVPSGGLTVNAPTNYSFYVAVAAQIAVESVGVTISDIVVDGTGAGCVAGTNAVFGIDYYNVGTVSDGTAAGKVQNVTVRNVRTSCFQGRGIFSDNSYITIANNELHDFDVLGIFTYGGTRNSVTNNSLQRPGFYGIYAENWAYSPNATLAGNTISNSSFAGILAFDEANISKNTITNNYVGLYLYFLFSSAITQNVVNNDTFGLEIYDSCCNTIQLNVFDDASQDGIRDEFSFGSNNVTKNTVNEAAFGIYTDSTAGGDTYAPNNLYNVVVTVDPGTVSGPGAPPNP